MTSTLNATFKLVATLLYVIAAVLAIIVTYQVVYSPGTFGAASLDLMRVVIPSLWGFLAIVTAMGQYSGRGTGTPIAGEGPGRQSSDTTDEIVGPITDGGG